MAVVALDTLRSYARLAIAPDANAAESPERARDDEALELGLVRARALCAAGHADVDSVLASMSE